MRTPSSGRRLICPSEVGTFLDRVSRRLPFRSVAWPPVAEIVTTGIACATRILRFCRWRRFEW